MIETMSSIVISLNSLTRVFLVYWFKRVHFLLRDVLLVLLLLKLHLLVCVLDIVRVLLNLLDFWQSWHLYVDAWLTWLALNHLLCLIVDCAGQFEQRWCLSSEFGFVTAVVVVIVAWIDDALHSLPVTFDFFLRFLMYLLLLVFVLKS